MKEFSFRILVREYPEEVGKLLAKKLEKQFKGCSVESVIPKLDMWAIDITCEGPSERIKKIDFEKLRKAVEELGEKTEKEVISRKRKEIEEIIRLFD